MNSRMNKYYENSSKMSRVDKNEDLYRNINDVGIDDYEPNNNATVLGKQGKDINLEQIKKIVDDNYQNVPQRRKAPIKMEEEYVPRQSIVPESSTKEYDINSFLAKAKDGKEETYEEARAKKLRDTQFDILNNLNLNVDKEEVKEADDDEDIDIAKLIEDINKDDNLTDTKEASDDDPLDMFPDLKGSDDTEIIKGLKEELANIEKEKPKPIVTSSIEEEKMDKSFYNDFDIFKKNDIIQNENAEEKLGIWVKLLIIVLVIVFLTGLFLFLKTLLEF